MENMGASIEYVFRWKKAHEDYLIENKIFLRQGGQSKKVDGIYSRRNFILFDRGEKIRIIGDVFVEEYSMMPFRSFCSVGAFSEPACYFSNDVVIGRYCSISSGVKVMGGQHPYDRFTTSRLTYKKEFEDIAKSQGDHWDVKPYNTNIGAPVIGNDVWIADDVVIKGNIKIGDGAVIAANSVVTKDVPPYAIVAGVPAKVIKYRFPEEVIIKLLKLKWWDYKFTDLPDNSHCDDMNYFIEHLSLSIERGDIKPIIYKKFNIGKELSEI
ncbi:CatB-related O-acetyltransferase [Providencia rettgeri]|uniref:CatB-related O-acetyltransferase n=1 Tax=Providencia rettgeri TaxID=587 RepID=A0AAP2JV46_PRORE|nr:MULTISPECIES: CatB-related O-acetyltransferase [Providencia]MBX6953362.1 CatB-related O-acetyltransferase [Providencia rettgeri]MBX6954519.1 CatB-related O-acetyltransferase [Providencia rettgeri]MBX6959981.1 CatB-related O-acetyltransferase [Providencia rettgeri]MBX6969985.1 CatB-related O-acetyltransferase [Providencia rettgeri]MBX6972321.1 CatB-related O-acetyltransferase [Providencia rettgeri]